MTLFASVRPDLSYYVQVQAPFSADWITQAQGDEEMTLTELGLLTIELQGVNGNYIGVDGSLTSHDGHSGYQLQSDAGTPTSSSQFFVAVQQNLQAAAQAPLFSSLSAAAISDEFQQQGAAEPALMAQQILAAVGN
jgi:hypothetical protein